MLFYLNRPEILLFLIVAFAIAVACHEANHAFVATALGDDTPRKYGRLTLNPLKHIDKTGMIMFAIALIGWGYTPINPRNLKPNPKTGEAIVAAAGPVANLALAILFFMPVRMGLVETSEPLFRFLIIGSSLNLMLFVLNLLPLPPLDGYTILRGVLPSPLAWKLRGLEQYGMGILFLLMLSPLILSQLGWRIPGCGLSFLDCLATPVSRALGIPYIL